MSAFDQGRLVEARSLAVLGPFIEATQERYVLTAKGRLAAYLQREVGDVLFNDRRGRVWSIELKAELRHTGNLFLETWSNRNLDEVASHAERGSTVGWLYTTRADLLLYHFVEDDRLYVLSVMALKRWAFMAPSRRSTMSDPDASGVRREMQGRLYDFAERAQAKYRQPNDTRGRLVPVTVLEREMVPPPVLLRPLRQLGLAAGSPDLSGGA